MQSTLHKGLTTRHLLTCGLVAASVLLTACSPESTETTSTSESQTTTAAVDTQQAFLDANAAKHGVTVTASGLQYRVITPGTGIKPGPTDTVMTHYHGTLIDGTVFDSSLERGAPLSFPLNRVIKGWTEGLQLMREGAKWELVIPSELAYGTRGSGKIKPGDVTIFEIELIEVQ